jgi:hypothetical protein
MEYRGDYTGVSIDYLIKAGALKYTKSPIGKDWSVNETELGAAFAINIMGLSKSDCEYFITKHFNWAESIAANTTNECVSGDNTVSFIVK